MTIENEMTLAEYHALTANPKPRKRGNKKRDAAETFERVWQLFGNPRYTITREHRFHPTRRWKIDCAFVDQMVAVEIEGGVWTGGRHTRGQGFIDDCEKYNAATEHGWLVLRYAATEVDRDPAGIVGQVCRVLDNQSRTCDKLGKHIGANKRHRQLRTRR